MAEGKTLIIVAGANGSIGKAYLEHFSKNPRYECIAVSRQNAQTPRNVKRFNIDLLDETACSQKIKRFSLSGIKQMVYIHAVGKFKFEPSGPPRDILEGHIKSEVAEVTSAIKKSVDPEVYRGNVTTFLNFVNPLLARRQSFATKSRTIPFVICTFGTVSAKYLPKQWESYVLSTEILANKASEIAKTARIMNLYSLNNQGTPNVRAIQIKLSSVDTQNERNLRPSANRKYWLTPQEVVAKTANTLVRALDDRSPQLLKIVKLFRPNPRFESTYYRPAKIARRWRRQMRRK